MSASGSVEQEQEQEQEQQRLGPANSPVVGRHARAALLKKALITICLLTCIVLVFVYRSFVVDTLEAFLAWVEGAGILGPLAYIGVYIIATVCFMPGSVLTLGAGFVFKAALGNIGILVSIIVVFIGASIGAVFAFLIARYVLRESVESWAKKSPNFLAIDRVLGEEGLKLIFLLRLSPLLPFNASNYIYGVTAVSLRNYTIACLGMMPGIIAFSLIGSSLGSISQAGSGDFDGGIGLTLFIIIGTVLALAVSVYVSVIARREIKKIVSDGNGENEPQEDSNILISGE